MTQSGFEKELRRLLSDKEQDDAMWVAERAEMGTYDRFPYVPPKENAPKVSLAPGWAGPNWKSLGYEARQAMLRARYGK